MGEEVEEENTSAPRTYDMLKPFIDQLPDKEADIVHLYFVCRKRQADIATMFGITQAAVSYRLDRAIERLKYLVTVPQIGEDVLREALARVFQPLDVDILVGMWVTTCQSEVAKQLSLTQGLVRHRFFRAVKNLEKAAEKDPELADIARVYTTMANKGFNLGREVKLPQWENRGQNSCK